MRLTLAEQLQKMQVVEDIRATHYKSKLGVLLFLRKLNNKLGKTSKTVLTFQKVEIPPNEVWFLV